MLSADYQQFELTNSGLALRGERMASKLSAIEPIGLRLQGKTVLDIGCDHGFWCYWASDHGADSVVGVDRGRLVRGEGYVDLVAKNNAIAARSSYTNVHFMPFEAGKQWDDLGPFNVVLLMSLYHHIYQNTGGDHASIWYWLWRQTNGELIWENPTDSRDAVVQMNVASDLHEGYTRELIKEHALEWFDITHEVPAKHEPYREIWRLVRKEIGEHEFSGRAISGAGGASKAFLHNDSARIKAIASVLGEEMVPGSLNVSLDQPFNFDSHYYRARIPDVTRRGAGLDVEWADRWARFYPVIVGGNQAYAMRFEGEKYPDNFVELIASEFLRDYVDERYVVLWQ